MTTLTPKPGIMDIALYQGGGAHLDGVANPIKLSANENPFGPSPKVIEAVKASAAGLHRYPGTDHAELRAAIGQAHDLAPEQIICGVGSDEVLQFVVHAYAGPGDEVLYTEHGFSMYPLLAKMVGATPIKVAERARKVDVDALLAACSDRTRVIFLTNPGNPTTTMIPEGEIARLADALPPHVLLVLDAAYAEYVEGFDGGAALVTARRNMLMTRTFSKIYGLGGMRVGWGYGPQEVIDVLNRIRQPFNLSNTALIAAKAALEDQDYLAFCRAENTRLRHWLTEQLTAAGVACDPSSTNFVLARFDDEQTANACNALLQKRGLIVRQVAGYGLPQALRMTIGDEPSTTLLAQAITDFQAGAEA